jgi:hypothetical protein
MNETRKNQLSDQHIVKAIQELTSLETQHDQDGDEVDLKNYKIKVKQLIQILMMKLEENHEYHKQLEKDRVRLESQVSTLISTTS